MPSQGAGLISLVGKVRVRIVPRRNRRSWRTFVGMWKTIGWLSLACAIFISLLVTLALLGLGQ